MAVLALLLPDASANARMASALSDDHRVIHAPSWHQLTRLVMKHPVDLCIVDLYDPFRPISLQQLQKLRRKHLDLAIVVHGDLEGRGSDLFELGRLRVDGVLGATGQEERHTIRRAVDGALARSAATRVVRTLDGRLSPFALDCLGWAVEHAESRPWVGDLASAMGTSAPALSRELRDRDLPSIRTILLWGRLLQASRLLQSGGMTVDSAAFRVGYATGGALRRALKKHFGYPPRELTRRGGLAAALTALADSLMGPQGPPPSRNSRARPRWTFHPR